MRFDKFTLKSQELIHKAQSLASQHRNQQIEPEYLLAVMLGEEEGIAKTLLRKQGASQTAVAQELELAIDKFPKITGEAVGEPYISPRTKGVLDAAFVESAKMKDQYVSIEHILLAILDERNGEAKHILSRHGVTKDSILRVLMEIRGSQRITDPHPEEK